MNIDWRSLPNAPHPGTRLCALDDIVDGGALLLTLGEGDPAFDLVVLRSGNELYGYLNRCAHFEIPLAKRQEHLVFEAHRTLSCNVHYARYDWHDGRCISGECAGEHLVAVPLQLQDGQVLVA
jgi:nitrite reductase/ring-hydroxylating ferredoxin subunit